MAIPRAVSSSSTQCRPRQAVFFLNGRAVAEVSGLPAYERYYPCVVFGSAGCAPPGPARRPAPLRPGAPRACRAECVSVRPSGSSQGAR